MTRARVFALGLIVGIVAGVTLVALGPWSEDLIPGRAAQTNEALRLIEDNYWRDADLDELDGASVRGIVRQLKNRFEDRFSQYFDEETFERFQSATSGEFSGVGLTVTEVGRGLRVTNVFDNTPAERAGITDGEVIVAVDGESIAGEPSDAATARIQGPPGSEVELRILDPESGRERDLTLERARVQVPAVDGRLVRVDGVPVAYVRLATFSQGAHGELRGEIERLYDRGAEALVLDLRGNGGGLLQEAVLTSSVFVEDGTVVTTRGRTKPRRDFEATGDAIEPRPTVVLIDRDSASASEILAAALAENDLATLVGVRTFGKGSFQEVIELDDGGALDLTVGEYLTGEGESLADSGIEPDVRSRDDDETRRDEVLQRGLDVLARELSGGS